MNEKSLIPEVADTAKVMRKLKPSRPWCAALASVVVTDAFREAGLCKKFKGAVPEYARPQA